MNVLANGYYMHLGRFVKGYQIINLKKPSFCFYAYRSFTDLHTRLFFLEHTSGRYYMRFSLFVKGYQTINLKKSSFRFYAYRSFLTSMFVLFFIRTAR